MLGPRDPGLSFRISELVKDLKTFTRAAQSKLDELERDPIANKELIPQQKSILENTNKEIRRLERKAFYLELGE